MIETVPLLTCPMSKTCKHMMAKRYSGVMIFGPGIFVIALGILIVIEPTILAWIIAAAFILMGAMMLMMVRFIRSVGG
jgi:hypothetical protein